MGRGVVDMCNIRTSPVLVPHEPDQNSEIHSPATAILIRDFRFLEHGRRTRAFGRGRAGTNGSRGERGDQRCQRMKARRQRILSKLRSPSTITPQNTRPRRKIRSVRKNNTNGQRSGHRHARAPTEPRQNREHMSPTLIARSRVPIRLTERERDRHCADCCKFGTNGDLWRAFSAQETTLWSQGLDCG